MLETANGKFSLDRAIEIDADVERVFSRWTRYEDFPHLMKSVRRIKRIDDRHVLWDVDVAGRQVMWEASIVERIPEELIRWESRSGADTSGEVRFEPLDEGRTRLSVEIEFEPDGLLERLGARLGFVDSRVDRDLDRFRDFVEKLPGGESDR